MHQNNPHHEQHNDPTIQASFLQKEFQEQIANERESKISIRR